MAMIKSDDQGQQDGDTDHGRATAAAVVALPGSMSADSDDVVGIAERRDYLARPPATAGHWNIQPGSKVLDRDGTEIGVVAGLGSDYLISQGLEGMSGAWWIPLSALARTGTGVVHLNLFSHDLRRAGPSR